MDTPQNTSLTNEEKMIGLFSHLSIFLGGIIVPLIFWLIYKEKSKFSTFHSLQALFYHLAYIVFVFFWVFILIFGAIGFSIFTAGTHAIGGHNGAPGIFVLGMIVFYVVLFITIFGFIGYAIYVGIKAYKGEYVKYPIIGNIVYKHVFGE
jgi:uncharacterized Tic20 family protein